MAPSGMFHFHTSSSRGRRRWPLLLDGANPMRQTEPTLSVAINTCFASPRVYHHVRQFSTLQLIVSQSHAACPVAAQLQFERAAPTCSYVTIKALNRKFEGSNRRHSSIETARPFQVTRILHHSLMVGCVARISITIHDRRFVQTDSTSNLPRCTSALRLKNDLLVGLTRLCRH